MSREPEIIINGINVGPGCALTLRVAIELFASYLIEDGLGDDVHGIEMKKNYLDRINDIRKAMGVIREISDFLEVKKTSLNKKIKKHDD